VKTLHIWNIFAYLTTHADLFLLYLGDDHICINVWWSFTLFYIYKNSFAHLVMLMIPAWYVWLMMNIYGCNLDHVEVTMI
jgi:hypothetical protein